MLKKLLIALILTLFASATAYAADFNIPVLPTAPPPTPVPTASPSPEPTVAPTPEPTKNPAATPYPASPEEYFIFDDTYGFLNGYYGPGGAVYVPETINGVPVKIVNNTAFGWQKGITEITFSNQTIVLQESAFYNCTGLVKVNLGDMINTIYRRPFLNCQSLKEINAGRNNSAFVTLDGVLYSRDMKRLVWYPQAKDATEYTIPEGVEEINEFAFSGAKNLVKVTLPSSLKKIGSSAFMWCENLSEIKFGENIETIEGLAFSGCASLKEARITSPVVTLGDWAFDSCPALEKVYLPSTLVNVGTYIFYGSPSARIVCLQGAPIRNYAQMWNIEVIDGDPKDFMLYDIFGHWAEDDIKSLVRMGIINGYEDGTFRPEEPISKAEFVKIMVIATDGEKQPVSNEWYSGYFSYLYNRVNIGKASFDTDWEKDITRNEIALVISRLLERKTGDKPLTATEKSMKFTDYAEFTPYVTDVVEKGLITGYEDGSFGGSNTATRAEASAMAVRAIQNYCK